jgi:hypothetical protein
MGNVAKGGDLIQGRQPANQYSDVEGSDLSMNAGVNNEFVGSYAPGDLSGDSTNRQGSCDGTDSDPMFEKFNRKDNHSGGGSFAGSVSGESLSGTDSDPMFETDRADADENDTRG